MNKGYKKIELCRCTKETTIEEVEVGECYPFLCLTDGAVKVLYNETDKTFDVLYCTEEYFKEYFQFCFDE